MTDVVVIGGGHAGLAASHALREAAIDHVVLERGRIGESWWNQRWDSFALNTPGSVSLLAGDSVGPGPGDAFWSRDAFAGYLEDYARRLGTDIRTGVAAACTLPQRTEPLPPVPDITHSPSASSDEPLSFPVEVERDGVERSLAVATGAHRPDIGRRARRDGVKVAGIERMRVRRDVPCGPVPRLDEATRQEFPVDFIPSRPCRAHPHIAPRAVARSRNSSAIRFIHPTRDSGLRR